MRREAHNLIKFIDGNAIFFHPKTLWLKDMKYYYIAERFFEEIVKKFIIKIYGYVVVFPH
jgi:hypothetical protein